MELSIILTVLSESNQIHAIRHETNTFTGFLNKYNAQAQIRGWFIAALRKGKFRVLEKTPKHVNHISEILRMFPRAKVIGLVRDPRDVCNSLMKRGYRLEEGIARWKHDNESLMKHISDKRVFVLKIEDFVANPEQNLKMLCNFVRIRYSLDLLNYHDKKVAIPSAGHLDPSNHKDFRRWQTNQPLMKSTVKWPQELREAQQVEIESQTTNLMSFFGYTR